MFSKIIIIVDKDVDVQNVEEVLFYVGSNVDPKRDVTIVEGPVDVLDHASPTDGCRVIRWGLMRQRSGQRKAINASGPRKFGCPMRSSRWSMKDGKNTGFKDGCQLTVRIVVSYQRE